MKRRSFIGGLLACAAALGADLKPSKAARSEKDLYMDLIKAKIKAAEEAMRRQLTEDLFSDGAVQYTRFESNNAPALEEFEYKWAQVATLVVVDP